MKKLFVMVALLSAFVVSNSFAGKCKSDLQFHIGAEGIWGKANYSGWHPHADAGAFDVGIENYNMFDLPVCGGDFMALGFMESFFGSFGGVTDFDGNGPGDFDTTKALGFNIVISPAFSLKFANVVKIQMILGLDFRYEEFGVKWDDSDYGGKVIRCPMLGVTTGAQAKFLPDNFVSPVAGIRYAWTGMSEFYENNDYDDYDDTKIKHSCHAHTFLFNIGVSLNFGNK